MADKGHTDSPVRAANARSDFQVFTDIDAFSKTVEAASGLVFNFKSIVELHTNFLECTDQYLILNIKSYNVEGQDNLIFITENVASIFSRKPFSLEGAKAFEKVLTKPFGRGTVLTFLTLDNALESNKQYLEVLINAIKKLEDSFSPAEYRKVAFNLESLDDRLEEFHDMILRLQERRYKQLETQHISFDYSVLIAESLSLQGRCRRRISQLKDIRQDNEMQTSSELNRRIARLDDVVKRLTAITIIIMLPTLLSSHFGMNFVFMPELQLWWAYPAVVVFELSLVAAGIYLFKRIGWL